MIPFIPSLQDSFRAPKWSGITMPRPIRFSAAKTGIRIDTNPARRRGGIHFEAEVDSHLLTVVGLKQNCTILSTYAFIFAASLARSRWPFPFLMFASIERKPSDHDMLYLPLFKLLLNYMPHTFSRFDFFSKKFHFHLSRIVTSSIKEIQKYEKNRVQIYPSPIILQVHDV
jgi:hypothetical protein